MGPNFIAEIIIWVIVGYFLGSVSFGYIIGKDAGVDIRESGSGNTGTTNALRTLGKKAAALTFLGDLFKAIIPVLVAKYLSVKVFADDSDMSYIVGLITGLSVAIGHNFPVWMKFKGGKGIAVTAGVTVAVAYMNWYYLVIAVSLFVIIVLITKYVSVGSLCVPAWALPVYAIIFERDNIYFTELLIISFLFTILAFVMHRENIKRLISGTENKLFAKKQ